MNTTNIPAVDAVIKAVEDEATRSIEQILDQVKASTGYEPGQLGRHWLELARFETAYAAIRVFTAKGWLRLPPDVAAAILLAAPRSGADI